MKAFRPSRGYAVVALAVAASLAGGAALQARSSLPPASPAPTAGGKVFGKWCGDCHSTAEGPGSLALQRKYRGAPPAILEQRGGLSPVYVRSVVRRGISFMPSFRKTEISDADLTLLTDYLASTQARTQPATKRPTTASVGE